jgi:uncharacterized GH25 family protein
LIKRAKTIEHNGTIDEQKRLENQLQFVHKETVIQNENLSGFQKPNSASAPGHSWCLQNLKTGRTMRIQQLLIDGSIKIFEQKICFKGRDCISHAE